MIFFPLPGKSGIVKELVYTCIIISLVSCGERREGNRIASEIKDTTSVVPATDTAPIIKKDSIVVEPIPYDSKIETKDIRPSSIVSFAQTLVGIPYKYGSIDPAIGFDCSGFITYVFNHFDIAVPRSSRDFTNVGQPVTRNEAKPGDLILFTGTDSSDRRVGHMGIVTYSSPDTLLFIHSTSGKLYSVTVTPLNKYYQGRFMKVIRIFDENNTPVAKK